MQVHTLHLFPWVDIDDIALAEWPFEDVPYDRDRAKELYEQYFEQIEFADEAGFDGVVFNEHHYSAYAMDPSPIVLASHVAARTDHLKLAFLGNVIPVRGNPIRVAEELAVLDTITGGRVIAGVARGIPMEYLAYNEDRGPVGPGEDRSREMFAEAVELIQQAWTADAPFDFDGEFWEYEHVHIWPQAYQEPRPPMWMPATSDASIRIAAEHRIAMAGAGPGPMVKQGFETYREFAREAGWEPSAEHFVRPQGFFATREPERAKEDLRSHSEFGTDFLFGGVHRGAAAIRAGDDTYDPEKHRDLVPEHAIQQMDADYDESVESGGLLLGEPEEIVAAMEAQYEAVGGFEHVVGSFQHGDAPQEMTMQSLELFADEVLPELQKIG